MRRRGTPRRRRRPFGNTRRHRQGARPPVGDPINGLGPRTHFDIEDTLVLRGDPAGLLEQYPQLGIGVRGPHVRQNRPLTSMFTHNLHCDGSRGRAHLPYVRHRPKLPA